MDLALNNQQWLICHKNQTTTQPTSSIIEASSSDCLVSYPGHSLGKTYFSEEMQSVYSAVAELIWFLCLMACQFLWTI